MAPAHPHATGVAILVLNQLSQATFFPTLLLPHIRSPAALLEARVESSRTASSYDPHSMPLARAHSHLPLNFWFSFFFDSHYDGIWRPSSLPTDNMTFVWNHCNAYFRGHGVSSGNATQFLRTNFIFIFSSVFFAENGIRVQPIDVNRLTTQCRLSLNSGFNFLGWMTNGKRLPLCYIFSVKISNNLTPNFR